MSATDSDCSMPTLGQYFVQRKEHLAFCLGVAHASDTFDHQIVLREGARLIEAADVNLAGQRDTPWLGAEDLLLDQLDD